MNGKPWAEWDPSRFNADACETKTGCESRFEQANPKVKFNVMKKFRHRNSHIKHAVYTMKNQIRDDWMKDAQAHQANGAAVLNDFLGHARR